MIKMKIRLCICFLVELWYKLWEMFPLVSIIKSDHIKKAWYCVKKSYLFFLFTPRWQMDSSNILDKLTTPTNEELWTANKKPCCMLLTWIFYREYCLTASEPEFCLFVFFKKHGKWCICPHNLPDLYILMGERYS